MGKAPKLLAIFAYGGVEQWEEVIRLFEQGHHFVDDPRQADLVIGPSAHRMTQDIRKHLPEAIAEARRIKYGSKKGDE